VIKDPPPGGDFVWDGKDEDERPLTEEQLDAARAEYRRKRGRPVGSSKVSTTIRFDADVVARFRARGRGWQSRMNAALREWLQAND
jgi:uncharacterized protein (DUF4415 family)